MPCGVAKKLKKMFPIHWKPGTYRSGQNRILLFVCSVSRSCPTLCDPMDCKLPGSSVHGSFRARILDWVAISYLRQSSRPRDQTCTLVFGRRILWHCHLGSPHTTFDLGQKTMSFCLFILFMGSQGTNTEVVCHPLLPGPLGPSPVAQTWCWERLRAGGEGSNRGPDGWMASLTQWMWVWANSGR